MLTQNSNDFTEVDDGTWIADAERGGGAILAGVLDAYWGRGYVSGYCRAVSDVRSSLLLVLEEYLKNQPGSSTELRNALHGFENYFNQHLNLPPDHEQYVSDGAGI